MPAQKVRPTPNNTSTRSFASAAQWSSAAIRASANSGSIEFARLGRLSVMRPMPAASMAKSKGSCIRCSLLGVSQLQDPFGVAVIEFFPERVRETELVPLLEQPLVRDARIVTAEHHLVLQPSAHVAHKRLRQISRRPARHLPIDIALVQRDRGGFFDPRVSRMRHDNGERGKI